VRVSSLPGGAASYRREAGHGPAHGPAHGGRQATFPTHKA